MDTDKGMDLEKALTILGPTKANHFWTHEAMHDAKLYVEAYAAGEKAMKDRAAVRALQFGGYAEAEAIRALPDTKKCPTCKGEGEFLGAMDNWVKCSCVRTKKGKESLLIRAEAFAKDAGWGYLVAVDLARFARSEVKRALRKQGGVKAWGVYSPREGRLMREAFLEKYLAENHYGSSCKVVPVLVTEIDRKRSTGKGGRA